jgi:hypothetical protein
LSSLTAFSQLFTSELRLLTGPLALAEFKRPEVILREAALASEAHIPLDSVARFTGQNAAEERVPDCPTWPGSILEFSSLPVRFSMQGLQ